MHPRIALHNPKRKALATKVISTVGRTSTMLQLHVLSHALVGAALSVQTLALSIHVFPALHAAIRDRTSAAQPGVMQHRIAYSPVPVD